ncbi:hypothetical protein [Lentibacillus jeotgali]|uniref:hypothetical protein n=1 Tax=Lentibacillus jeotgali TaxID=558169 RepID=UPI0002626028|nr:hypothetical protein [Lentibacillus jeotgali]
MPLPSAVGESHSMYTHHDQLFKELMNTFFPEFLEGFFPEIYYHIDFNAVISLPAEDFSGINDKSCPNTLVLMKIKIQNQDALLMIHYESLCSGRMNLRETMYSSYSLLYSRYKMPILPIAVTCCDEGRYESDEFTMGILGFHILNFHYLKLELWRLNWRHYIQSNNPAAAALLSNMKYTRDERDEVKKGFLRMLANIELNPAQIRLIHTFFEANINPDH